MAPSQEEKSHTNGTQEIPKSVNRWYLCLPTVSRLIFLNAAVTVSARLGFMTTYNKPGDRLRVFWQRLPDEGHALIAGQNAAEAAMHVKQRGR